MRNSSGESNKTGVGKDRGGWEWENTLTWEDLLVKQCGNNHAMERYLYYKVNTWED